MINHPNHQSTDKQCTEWEIEVAKRIACAVVSYRAGVAYEDLWAQFADQREDVGTYWLSVAKQIGEDFTRRPYGRHGSKFSI
jgi:hypothetical protein